MLSGFNGLIAYGLGSMDGQAGVRGWQWILIVPGAITIFLALPLYAFVSDFPEKAKWLQPHEKQYFHDRLMRDRGEEVEKPGFKHIFAALTDWKAWMLGTFM
jgi:sugar phosphate permease